MNQEDCPLWFLFIGYVIIIIKIVEKNKNPMDKIYLGIIKIRYYKRLKSISVEEVPWIFLWLLRMLIKVLPAVIKIIIVRNAEWNALYCKT